MKIKRIDLENIGSHKETHVGFDDMPNIMAITGQNGTGKTFLIEAVPATLYGAFPTRPGSIYDKITKGYEGEAYLQVQFEMNEGKYMAERKLTKKGKTALCEARLFEGNVLIAGPKVKDFEEAVINLLGPQALFLASVFSSQNSSGDLCDAKPSERKAVFARMLGLERIDDLSKAAKKWADILRATLAGDTLKLTEKKEKAKGIKEAELQLENTLGEIERWKKQGEVSNEKLARIEDKIKDYEISKEKYRGLIDRADRIKREISKLNEELQNDRKKYQELAILAGSIKEIETEMTEVSKLRERRDALQTQLVETEKVANSVRLQKNKVANIETNIESLKRQVELLEKIPGEKCCKACPLVAGAYEAQGKIPDLIKEVNDILKGIKEDGADVEKIVRGIREEISGITKSITASPAKNTEGKYAKAQAAAGSMKILEKTGKDKVSILKEKNDELKGVAMEIEDLGSTDADEILIKDAKVLRENIENGARIINDLSSENGKNIERIASIKLAIQEVERLEPEYMAKEIKINDYDAIARAFGKQGIQPIIIDEARPEMEDIADELLCKATDGRMRIRFETQKKLKSGDTSESLDIIISKDGYDRDIAEFSGGEQKLLRTIIRLTIAAWQARKGGNRLKTLFVDEAFENLDQENASKILSVFDSLRQSFDKIILISHDDSMIEEMPARINLEKSAGKVEIRKFK